MITAQIGRASIVMTILPWLRLLVLVVTGIILGSTAARSQEPMAAGDLEVFLAKYPANQLLPECSEGGAQVCAFDLIIQVRRVDPASLLPDQDNALDLLPAPLLSTALFNLERPSGDCRQSDLIAELSSERQASATRGEMGLIMALPEDVAGCWNRVHTVLMWAGGEVFGWLACDGQQVLVCDAFLYPPRGNPLGAVSIEVGAINASAAQPLIRHIGAIVQRVGNLVEAQSGRTYRMPVAYDDSALDDETRRLLR